MFVNLQLRHALKFTDRLIGLVSSTLLLVEDTVINYNGPNYLMGYEPQQIEITSQSDTTAKVDVMLGDSTILFTYAVQLTPGHEWTLVQTDIAKLAKACVASVEADMCATAALVSRRSNESKLRSAHNYVRYHPTRKEKRDQRRRGKYQATCT